MSAAGFLLNFFIALSWASLIFDSKNYMLDASEAYDDIAERKPSIFLIIASLSNPCSCNRYSYVPQ